MQSIPVSTPRCTLSRAMDTPVSGLKGLRGFMKGLGVWEVHGARSWCFVLGVWILGFRV